MASIIFGKYFGLYKNRRPRDEDHHHTHKLDDFVFDCYQCCKCIGCSCKLGGPICNKTCSIEPHMMCFKFLDCKEKELCKCGDCCIKEEPKKEEPKKKGKKQ